MALEFFFLLFGFGLNFLSAFTHFYSSRFGEKTGSTISAILRNLLGIPIWAAGFIIAAFQPEDVLFPVPFPLTVFGWILIIFGASVIVGALAQIRARSFHPKETDTLIETGVYGIVRHPIHFGTLLEFAGVLLVLPTMPMALACGMGVLWLIAQTWAEEKDLLARMPQYALYQNRVPMLLPRFHR